MNSRPVILDADRRRKLGALLAVCIAHAGAFTVMGRSAPSPSDPPQPPPIEVRLFERVVPPPPPPPDLPPSPEAGGGAPAAPSRIHTPPEPPPDVPREIPAPVQQAPTPTLIVGTAPIASATPGMGQGGVGTGTGSGIGAGSGPGTGGTRPVIITGPTQGQISRAHPREAFRRRIDGRVELLCVIRLDTRLESCRVLNETPGGMGFGEAALGVAGSFRFRPATENGRPVEGGTIRPWVEFGDPDRGGPPVG